MIEKWGKLVHYFHQTQREGLNMEVFPLTVHRYLELDIASDEEAIVQIKGIRSTRHAAEIRVGTGREDKSLGRILSRAGETFDEEVKLPQGTSKVYITIKGVEGAPTVNLTIANVVIVSRRVNFACFLHPREVKEIGERVECTITGLHSTGVYLHPSLTRIPINKSITGIARGVWTAPADGYLEVRRDSNASANYARCKLNGQLLEQTATEKKQNFYVHKWEVVLETWINTGYSTKANLTIDNFITVM